MTTVTSTHTAQRRSTPPVGDQRQDVSTPTERNTSSTQPGRPWFRPSGRWIVFFIVLLALDTLFSMRATEPAARVRVPYSPFFLGQVRADHVESISSKGT